MWNEILKQATFFVFILFNFFFFIIPSSPSSFLLLCYIPSHPLFHHLSFLFVSLSPGWGRRAEKTTSLPSSGRRTETDRNSSTPSSNSYATSSHSTTPRAGRLIGQEAWSHTSSIGWIQPSTQPWWKADSHRSVSTLQLLADPCTLTSLDSTELPTTADSSHRSSSTPNNNQCKPATSSLDKQGHTVWFHWLT